MKLKLLEETFSIVQLSDMRDIDYSAPFVFVQKTNEEISMVCPVADVPSDVLNRDDNYRGFCIDGKLNYNLIGIAAKISAVLASHTIGLFSVSSCFNQYFFIKADRLTEAKEALAQKGYFLT